MSTTLHSGTTLEWFGATTFRLKAKGITIFLDTWLERPEGMPSYLKIDQVKECDYIFISHAHFDHLPGADRLAKATGAIIVANGEAISVMRIAGVPESQLMAVAGGERIPIFTAAQRCEAIECAEKAAVTAGPPGPPGHGQRRGPPGPPMPDPETAPITVHAWPSLHCVMPPGAHPEFINSGTVYTGAASHACTLDVTRGLTYGLGSLVRAPQIPPGLPDDMRRFAEYMRDRETNRYSFFDGGQLMFNFLLGDDVLLWSGHLGAYEGIMRSLEPKPNVAILAIAGRANLNGRPFDGSAADFAVKQVEWLGHPERVIWCLHDRGAINPKYIDTTVATDRVNKETRSMVVDLEHAKIYSI